MTFLFVTVLLSLGQAQTGDMLLFLNAERLPDISDFGTVYKLDLAQRVVTPIYQRKGTINEIRYSRSGKRVLVAGFDQEYKFSIDIIDLNGELINRIENGVSAVFLDSDGSRIAFTKATHAPGESLVSQGTWIQDFGSGRKTEIWDKGVWLELNVFNASLYIRDTRYDVEYHVYRLDKKVIADVQLGYGEFSPNGDLRWEYDGHGGVDILRGDAREVISSDFEIMTARKHGTPLYWMNDRIIMLPRSNNGLEDYLLFVDTGRTLKAPGRILSITDDEQSVYICKPGLVLEKLPMAALEVLYVGKTENADLTEEGRKDAGK